MPSILPAKQRRELVFAAVVLASCIATGIACAAPDAAFDNAFRHFIMASGAACATTTNASRLSLTMEATTTKRQLGRGNAEKKVVMTGSRG